MRKPFSDEDCHRSRYWRAMLRKAKAPPIDDTPEPGFYRRRLVRGGPWVPVRIWIEQEIDDAGELLLPPRYCCEINGRSADAWAEWLWCASEPITESELAYLLDLGRYAIRYAPDEPQAMPDAPIDWLKVKPPF